MVPLILLLLLSPESTSAAEATSKKNDEKVKDAGADAATAGTDFVPHFRTLPFHPQPAVFGPPQDLTPLQQTHVLGGLHRFQPPRLPPAQFAPPVLTQASVFQGPPNNLQQVLLPPQPPQSHHLNPPLLNQQPRQLNQQSNFLSPPQQIQQNHVDSFAHIQLQNQVRANNLVRFPQQNFVSQQTNFQRPPFPSTPKVNQFQQAPQQLQQTRFNVVPQFSQTRTIINQSPVTSPPPVITHQPSHHPVINQQQTFRQTQSFGSNFVSNDLSQSFTPNSQSVFHAKIPANQQNDAFLRNQQNIDPLKPYFGSTNFPKTNEIKTQFQVNVIHNKPETQQPVLNHLPVNQNNFIQNHIAPSVQPAQQPIQPLLPVQQPTFETQPTVFTNFHESISPVFHSDQLRVTPSSAPQLPLVVSTTPNPNIFIQKSQEQQQYRLEGDFFSKKTASSETPTTAAATVQTVSTPRPTKAAKTPKPIVKEIRINLDENNNPILKQGVPQLYIKDTRQKQLQEIHQKLPVSTQNPQKTTQSVTRRPDKKEKSSKKSKKEKSQEDLINEQIQKLLQSHNLEIIDKPGESAADSKESQISKFTETIKGKYNYDIQLINGGDILTEQKTKKQPVLTTTLPPLPDLPEDIKKDYEVKLVSKDELFKQFQISSDGEALTPGNVFGNNSIFLANGQELEILNFGKDGTMKKIPFGGKVTAKKSVITTPKPPKLLFEELAKGAIPPGADFELIRQNAKGEIEKVNDFSAASKVTFVLLEEQPDGSVKVQGVKGNGDQENADSESVDSLIKKIKDGSLKLPPSQSTKPNSFLSNEIPRKASPTTKPLVTLPPSPTYVTLPPSQGTSQKSTSYYTTSPPPKFYPSSVFPTSATSLPSSSVSPYFADIESITAEYPTTTNNLFRTTVGRSKTKPRIAFLPTLPTAEDTDTTTFASQRIKPTSSSTYLLGSTPEQRKAPKKIYTPVPAKSDEPRYKTDSTTYRPVQYLTEAFAPPNDVIAEESSNIAANRPLSSILKNHKLSQMAKFLEQSGLDTILNETGPYTIFIPTDKAFKALEDQLGGTDRAEDKFRENPRLLSGLLLHHVVPGAFRIEDLLDEMTGVSLAGTQLRVNTYNEGKQRIVTVNGAKVSTGIKNIGVPQGLAHAVDRVLFPLPVGDILQTLRGDRERRFTKFIKSLEAAGLTDMLTGTKTYTVFAPVDSAFSALTDAELDKLLSRKEAAKTIVLRHVVPGALYSAGMKYYQVKNSMEEGQKIEIYKETGIIKANSAQVISPNIPATNGVIHAVETLL